MKFQQNRFVDAAVFAVMFLLTWQLRERDFEFDLESDYWPEIISAWRNFFHTFRVDALPQPGPHVYLDGQHIAYAFSAEFLRVLTALFPSLHTAFPTDASYNIGGAFLANATFFAVGCWLFYRLIYRIAGGPILAFGAALALCLSPQMIDINLLRIDHMVMGPLIGVLYCSTVYARGEQKLTDAIGMGVSLAVLATLKLNGIFFALFPAIGVLSRFLARSKPILNWRFVAWSCGVFVALITVLMFRYWVYQPLPAVLSLLIEAARSLEGWDQMFATSGPAYYLIDLFKGQGFFFVLTYIVCSLLVILQAFRTRAPTYIFFGIAFVLFSIFGVFSMHYPRGGYHLLPLYLVNVALILHACLSLQGPRQRIGKIAAAAIALSLVGTVAWSATPYLNTVHAAEARIDGVRSLRRAPRQWLRDHVPAGSTVCILRHSEWALPPIIDLGFRQSYGPFEFPYLSPSDMAVYRPPSRSAVEAACTVLLLDDFHTTFYDERLAQASQQNHEAWKALFSDISAHHPSTVFIAASPLSGVSRIEIVDLQRPKSRQ